MWWWSWFSGGSGIWWGIGFGVKLVEMGEGFGFEVKLVDMVGERWFLFILSPSPSARSI